MTEALRALIADWRRLLEHERICADKLYAIGERARAMKRDMRADTLRTCADDLEKLLRHELTVRQTRTRPAFGATPDGEGWVGKPCGCEVYQTCEKCR